MPGPGEDGDAVAALDVELALHLAAERGDVVAGLADQARREHVADGRLGRGRAGIGERLAPADDAVAGLDPHQQHVALGPAARLRPRPVIVIAERDIEADGVDAGDGGHEPRCPRPSSVIPALSRGSSSAVARAADEWTPAQGRGDDWGRCDASSFLLRRALQPAVEFLRGEVAALIIVADRVGAAASPAPSSAACEHGFGIAARLVAVAVGDAVVPPAARVVGHAVEDLVADVGPLQPDADQLKPGLRASARSPAGAHRAAGRRHCRCGCTARRCRAYRHRARRRPRRTPC